MGAYNIIQHLSGAPLDWATNDIVIPNGEWAFEELEDGSRQGKIGNGISKWSELPYIFQDFPDPKIYNTWTKLWEFVCDGTLSNYSFSEDMNGNPIDYSEIYLEINCPSAAQVATTTIEFNESFTIYITETALPSTSALVHIFHAFAQLEQAYRAKGVPGSVATTQFSNIINISGESIGRFGYIHFFNDKELNYPSGTIVRLWGK